MSKMVWNKPAIVKLPVKGVTKGNPPTPFGGDVFGGVS